MRSIGVLLLTAAAALAQRPVQTFSTSAGDVKITPIRHASVLIEAGGNTLYVDPVGQGNYDGLPRADLILITDIHGDHMDVKQIAALKKDTTRIIAPAAVAETVKEADVIAEGGQKQFKGWTIEAIAAYNLTRGPQPGQLFHTKGRGVGYVLTYGGKRFYFSGDTEGTPEMRRLKSIDVAFVCMNLPYTMTPEEAADAVKAFAPAVAIPYHYRNSDLSKFEAGLKGTKTEVRILNWYY